MSKFLKAVTLSTILSSVFLLQGCITPLERGQKQEMAVYEEKGLAVHEKSVAGAGIAGVLPTVGYFYTGHPVLAVTTIPLYPFLGFLWMPFDAAHAAENRNYYATKNEVARKRRQELNILDTKFQSKQITEIQYIRQQREVDEKYSAY